MLVDVARLEQSPARPIGSQGSLAVVISLDTADDLKAGTLEAEVEPHSYPRNNDSAFTAQERRAERSAARWLPSGGRLHTNDPATTSSPEYYITYGGQTTARVFTQLLPRRADGRRHRAPPRRIQRTRSPAGRELICDAGAMSDSPSSHRAAIAVEIRPGVGMLALLSSMNYKPWYALSEFVDNALASFLANAADLALPPHQQSAVTVTIRFERDPGRIEIVDDAAGIAAADVARAFRPAQLLPDVTGLAQFGIGMKSASCWYAKRFSVSSTALGEPVERTVRSTCRQSWPIRSRCSRWSRLPTRKTPTGPRLYLKTCTVRSRRVAPSARCAVTWPASIECSYAQEHCASSWARKRLRHENPTCCWPRAGMPRHRLNLLDGTRT